MAEDCSCRIPSSATDPDRDDSSSHRLPEDKEVDKKEHSTHKTGNNIKVYRDGR